MIGAIALTLAVLAFLALWARLIITSRHRMRRALGAVGWMVVFGSYVAFMGFAGINRLDCPGFEEAAGWRVFEMGTDDICDERSLFDVLF